MIFLNGKWCQIVVDKVKFRNTVDTFFFRRFEQTAKQTANALIEIAASIIQIQNI